MTVIHKLVQFYVELHHLAFWIKTKRLTESNWDVKKGYSVDFFFFLVWRIPHLSLRHVRGFSTV